MDPGTGRDTQVTERGGAFLFICLPFPPGKQLRNARGGGSGDGGGRGGRASGITVKAARCQMFGSILSETRSAARAPNLPLGSQSIHSSHTPTKVTGRLPNSNSDGKNQAIAALRVPENIRVYIFKGEILAMFFSKQPITMFGLNT